MSDPRCPAARFRRSRWSFLTCMARQRLPFPALLTAVLLCGGCATRAQVGFGPRTAPGFDPTLIPGSPPDGAGSSAPPYRAPAQPTPLPDVQSVPLDSSSGKLAPIVPGPILEAPEASRRNSRYEASNTIAQAPHTTRYHPTGTGSMRITDRPSLVDEPLWSRSRRSTDQRPIDTVSIGSGSRKVAVLASLHGDETQSVVLVEQVARYLKGHSEQAQDLRVLLIRVPNPDGRFMHSPFNVHGVDLNRNFPAPNWKPVSSNRSGDRPGSEVETREIMRLLTEFAPALIVHIKDSRTTGRINCEGAADEYAAQAAQRSGYTLVKNLGRATSGSMEHYATSQLNCPSVTLLLPRERTDAAAWDRHGATVLAAFQTGVSPPSANFLREDDPFAQRNDRSDPAAFDQQRPGTSNVRYRDQLSEFPAPVPDEGYLELPPPP